MKQSNINSDLESLFISWQQSELHNGEAFNRDGLVNKNPLSWKKQKNRILFLLKEAYHEKSDEKEIKLNNGYYDLCEDLYKNGPWKMWHRVSEWAYGINNTNENNIANYADISEVDKKKANELKKIAVINLKKSGGKSQSKNEDIDLYTRKDKEFIKSEIEILKPNIIVCGYTFGWFNEYILDKTIDKENERNKNCYYRYKGNLGDFLILDYYHPAWYSLPAFLGFYGLCSIYQKALQDK